MSHEFQALHEARARLARMGALSDPELRKIYDVIDRGMNPDPREEGAIVPFHESLVDFTEGKPTNGYQVKLTGDREVTTYRFTGVSGIGIEIRRPTLDGKTSELHFGLSEDAATALCSLLIRQLGNAEPSTRIDEPRAKDCVEWMRIFRMQYDHHLGRGNTDAAEGVESLFYAMWDGYGGECSRRWCDLIGAPVEDGSKVLHQEEPYECLFTWLGKEPR